MVDIAFEGCNMSREWLKYNYFMDRRGRLDSTVDSLGDCMSQVTYVIGSKEFNGSDFYKVYLNESTFILQTEYNNLHYLGTKENVWRRCMIAFYMMDDSNHQNCSASEKVSKLLQREKPAIIAPIVERLPFEELYDPNYKENEPKSEHYFSIIAEDERNFYFIDNPAVINRSNFIPYEGNNEIGIISKKDFDDLSEGYCKISTPIFNEEIIKKVIEGCEDVFRFSYENYNKKTSSKGNISTFYGIEALNKFSELLENGNMRFEQDAPSKDRDLITYFRWRIWHIKGRRNLQIKYLKDVYDTSNEKSGNLISALGESLKYWGLLNDNLFKDFLKGKSNADSRYVPLINKIISSENEMHSAYRGFIENV